MSDDFIRSTYRKLLKGQVSQDDFKMRMLELVTRDKFFFPAHLELLWMAEKERDELLYKDSLDFLIENFTQVFKSAAILRALCSKWTHFDQSAFVDIFDTIDRAPHLTLWTKSWFRYHKQKLPNEFLTATPKKDAVHLILKSKVEVSSLNEELSNALPYWWLIDTSRQRLVRFHQDTWTIPLRWRPNRNLEYTRVDGVHESCAASYVSAFPLIHKKVLDLAKECNLGLGNVNIVKMKPHSQSYRHWDTEAWYVNRNRFHLVLACGENNVLSSGDDTCAAQVGEVWFFDNKVMHRAHNKSDQFRTHVIFDGYPLDAG